MNGLLVKLIDIKSKIKIDTIRFTSLVVIVGLLFANSFSFVYQNAIPLVKSDGWRFINTYLVPWYSDEFELSMLWLDSHPQPLTGLLFIANAEIFGLRMDYEAIYASIFSIFLFVLLAMQVKNSIDNYLSKWTVVFSLLGIASVVFSLTSTPVYTWSLVTLGFIFLVFATLSIGKINSIIRRDSHNAYNYFLIWLIASLLMLVFSNAATLFIVAVILMLLSKNISEKKLKDLNIIVILAVSIALYKMVIWILVDNSVTNNINSNISLDYLLEYIKYSGVGLLSGWVNVSYITTNLGLDSRFVIAMGIFVLIIYIITICIYFRTDLPAKSITPGVLIYFSMLTVMAAMLYRYNPESHTPMQANVPRYYLLYAPAVIGSIWIWLYWAIESNTLNKLRYIVVGTILLVVIFCQSIAAYDAWTRSPYIRNMFLKQEQIMMQNASGDMSKRPAGFMVGSNYPSLYLKGLKFLKEKKLNIFSEK